MISTYLTPNTCLAVQLMKHKLVSSILIFFDRPLQNEQTYQTSQVIQVNALFVNYLLFIDGIVRYNAILGRIIHGLSRLS